MSNKTEIGEYKFYLCIKGTKVNTVGEILLLMDAYPNDEFFQEVILDNGKVYKITHSCSLCGTELPHRRCK